MHQQPMFTAPLRGGGPDGAAGLRGSPRCHWAIPIINLDPLLTGRPCLLSAEAWRDKDEIVPRGAALHIPQFRGQLASPYFCPGPAVNQSSWTCMRSILWNLHPSMKSPACVKEGALARIDCLQSGAISSSFSLIALGSAAWEIRTPALRVSDSARPYRGCWMPDSELKPTPMQAPAVLTAGRVRLDEFALA